MKTRSRRNQPFACHGSNGSNQPEAVIHDLVQPKPVFVLSVKSRTPPGSSRYQPPVMSGWLNGLGRSDLTQARRRRQFVLVRPNACS